MTLATAERLPKAKIPVPCPFGIVVDDREITGGQWFAFDEGITSKGSQTATVVECVRRRLVTGDYSIVGMEHLVTIERKAISDLWGSLGTGRQRFEEEHERMAAMVAVGGYCAVVIEGNWGMIARGKPSQSRVHFNSIYGTACHWSMRYRVPWWAENGRRDAELRTYRLLEAFWRQYEKRQQAEGWDAI